VYQVQLLVTNVVQRMIDSNLFVCKIDWNQFMLNKLLTLIWSLHISKCFGMYAG